MGQNNINTPPPGKLPSFFRLRLPPRQLEMIFLRDNYALPEGGSLKAATFSSFFMNLSVESGAYIWAVRGENGTF